MEPSRRATGYDLFKLIVAVILLILFLVLLRRPAAQPFTPVPPTQVTRSAPAVTAAASPVAGAATSTALTSTETANGTSSPTRTIEAAMSPRPSPTEATLSESATAFLAATATDDKVLTVTPLPSPTGTPSVESTRTPTDLPSNNATPIPSPTHTATLEPTPAPIRETPPSVTACEAALSRSRLQPGRNATILRRLNFRSSPGIRDNWLGTNIPGTKAEVIGGPECLPHVSGAYVWWQIRLPDGEVGWSAEGSVHGTFYFMEPAQ